VQTKGTASAVPHRGTRSFEGYGLQPVHNYLRVTAALAAEGCDFFPNHDLFEEIPSPHIPSLAPETLPRRLGGTQPRKR
jgi:hypothetical protein